MSQVPQNPSKLDPMAPRDPSAADGHSVGPWVMAQFLRDRSLRLAAGLAVAIAIPVAVLFYFQFRSIEDLGRSSTVVKSFSTSSLMSTTLRMPGTLILSAVSVGR